MAPDMPSTRLTNDGDAEKAHLPSQSASRRLFGKQIVITLVFFLLSAWICAIWIFSSAFKQPERASHLRILVADLDGGQVGEYFCCRWVLDDSS